MLSKTHIAFGILAGVIALPLVNFPSISHYVVYFGLITFGVLLPDIDHPNSKLNNNLPIFKIIPLFFKHRGFFHSIFPPIILGLLIWKYVGFFISLPLFTGYLAHLISDALTINGINFFHPLFQFKIAGPVRTGNWLEAIIFYFVLAGIVFRVYTLLN